MGACGLGETILLGRKKKLTWHAETGRYRVVVPGLADALLARSGIKSFKTHVLQLEGTVSTDGTCPSQPIIW
jgi:hypothetical protein